MRHYCGLDILEEFLEPGQLKEFRKEGEVKEEDSGLFKVWTSIKAKLLHVTTFLYHDREKESVQDVDQNLVPESGPTDNTDEDREQVPVLDVDHNLLTEFGHDDSIEVDRDQLGISNFESVGHYG